MTEEMKNYEIKPDSDNNAKIFTDNTKNLFKGKNIYVEIFNNNIDRSDIINEIMESHGANVTNDI
jgi:hypothetical protein